MTKGNRNGRVVAWTLALSLTASLVPPPASAQNLFEILFGGPVKHRKQRGELLGPVSRAKSRDGARAAAPKIAAPIYYTYKAASPEKVDFTALRSLPQTVSALPVLTLSNFREAAAGLTGFELSAEKEVAKALTEYYAANPEFIWVSGFSANGRAQEALRVFGEAASHGLVPAEYAVAVPPAGFSIDDTANRLQELIRFEMTMSARALRYIRDAQSGRVEPNKLSGYHDFPVEALDMLGALRTLATGYETREFLESFHPRTPEYAALRVELEALDASEENDIVVDAKLLLRPGETSAELPKMVTLVSTKGDEALGTEFADVIAQHGASEVYAPELVPLFKAAQQSVGLKPDGVIGPRTVAAFAGRSKADRLQKVLYALEQLRWHPSELGPTRVFINQPAYSASYYENGVEQLAMRTVIGTASNQTTFFYDEIEQVDYNPYWGVPQSIIVNEMLPRLRQDPGYLDRAGYEVTDAKGRRVSSSSINWGAYGSKIPFSVRQTPSEANSLGELKILFPNKHAIYMHDTPQKALFERDARAFSHGCVRLQDPRGMAAAVLGKSRDYVAEKLAKGHSTEKVARKIPVYVAYFTAWPAPSGEVQYFDDVYDRDSHLKAALDATDAARLPSS
ncbi:L,D-transpeptidase family protein [Arvimicrobium flavum]|uniref:L,D-transpeptidase family protein n=1 Tax=Arvimicrobium flavum TaxID=3393320 RepID=UPI00237AD43E|nr:L,D-transpeptidase family protein [Mesorhizobium shangrilense]